MNVTGCHLHYAIEFMANSVLSNTSIA